MGILENEQNLPASVSNLPKPTPNQIPNACLALPPTSLLHRFCLLLFYFLISLSPSHSFGKSQNSRFLSRAECWVYMARKKIREYDSKRLLKEHLKRLSGIDLQICSAQVGSLDKVVIFFIKLFLKMNVFDQLCDGYLRIDLLGVSVCLSV